MFMENKKLKKPSIKDQFLKESDGSQGEERKLMTKEETIAFYEESIPFMKLQDEYEKLAYSFAERKVNYLELQVREIEAIGYLSQWKAGQDEAKRRQEQEEKIKAEWDAMTPEQKEQYNQMMMEGIRERDEQIKAAEQQLSEQNQ